ncbi:MAG TPA: beta-L-arabinofuranosidase domain-containing protein [Parafilimonas sp.]|nr:beta-L-arabinofuranosidase domain-containing protein [Parafilimonas sp.]
MNKIILLTFLFTFFHAAIYGQAVEVNDNLKSMPFSKVQLTDKFWLPRIITEQTTLLPFAFDKTAPAVDNLRKTANFLKGVKDSLPFPHRYIASDLYKVMEGASYLLMINRDAALEKKMDSIIDIIAAAQKPDGYLYEAHITGVAAKHPAWGGGGMGDKPYSWEVHSHELYNMGHMYEGAVAYYLATGKDKWLKVAEKSANHINKVFFIGDSNYNNGKPVMQAPGHEELELALVKLYTVTGNKLYLDMAKRFLEIRGVTYKPEGEGVMAPTYAQQHLPVKEQRTAVGHAVRATYLYSGMADVSALTNDSTYNPALTSIWHDIVDTKMHITGGLGAVHGIEGFGPDYVLPNKNAYNETCAAVGNVLFNHRMFLMSHDAKYMDVAEVALFNNVLAGVNIEGNKFFYVNPLEADGKTPFNQGVTGRSPWFGTACCPTNISRLIPQVSGMMYAYVNEDIYCTLYGSNVTTVPLANGSVRLEQVSDYPFNGKVQLTVNPETDNREFKIKFRIPAWAHEQFVPGKLYKYVDEQHESWFVTVNGKKVHAELIRGFATISGKWKQGDVVSLYLPMPVRFNKAIDNVKDDLGRISVTRGPLVYCAEDIDNQGSVLQTFIDNIQVRNEIKVIQPDTGFLYGVPFISFPAKTTPDDKNVILTLLPYYAWNNRGEGAMEVWFPVSRNGIQNLNNGKIGSADVAKVTTSQAGEEIDRLTLFDGDFPKLSSDENAKNWIASATGNESPWIDIELKNEKNIQSVGVFWADDTINVQVPASWALQYKQGDDWLDFPLYVTDAYSLFKDQFNVVHPGKEIRTRHLRINMQPRGDKTIGIFEIKIESAENK